MDHDDYRILRRGIGNEIDQLYASVANGENSKHYIESELERLGVDATSRTRMLHDLTGIARQAQGTTGLKSRLPVRNAARELAFERVKELRREDPLVDTGDGPDETPDELADAITGTKAGLTIRYDDGTETTV